MRRITALAFFFSVLVLGQIVGCALSGEKQSAAGPVYVQMTTTMGDIVLELDRERAPISVANFLNYVDEGAYDGTIFHRVMEEFVIQGGGHLPNLTELEGGEPIKNEWGNGLKNERGTIGMARETEPDSAVRQWYINVADNERLDIARDVSGGAGYAVFGRVIRGMDVVDRIRKVKTHDREDLEMGDVPVKAIVIERVRRVDRL